jgi:putative transposase
VTPATVHGGRASEFHTARTITRSEAYADHPERFVRRPPTPPDLPTAAWINPPSKKEVSTQ